MVERTPSQTIGPFFHEALRWPHGGEVPFAEPAKRITLVGRMLDGAGAPVSDAMVETWQRSPGGGTPQSATQGARAHGFARVETAKDGTFRIETALPGGDAPFIDVAIFARGLLRALRTRVYLADEERVRRAALPDALAASPRLRTLIATRSGETEYRWEVRLQGDGETVFFAF